MNNEEYFNDIKEKYSSLRRQNKVLISQKLKEEGFIICRGDGKETSNYATCGEGIKKYTNNGTIAAYDLSNFQYIYAKKDNYDIYISLQCFDKDIKTNNYHVLMDRIGICFYNYDTKCHFEDSINKMINTNIDLPINGEKISLLIDILNKEIEVQNEKR